MALPRDARYPRQVPIDAYGDGGFRFADMSHRGSLFCLPGGMHAWEVTEAAGVGLDTLVPALEEADALDVLLIGLGREIVFLDRDIHETFRARRVIVEAVGTGSAVRTYNVLLAEGRAVGAALIAVAGGR